jgi:hypothetical protein
VAAPVDTASACVQITTVGALIRRGSALKTIILDCCNTHRK